jgi:ADP-ribose pyrophosphatase YjhB (NUDIX family)
MEIKSTIQKGDEKIDLIYKDIDNEDQLEGRKISGVHAWCFCADKMVVVYNAKKDRWTPPGGGVGEGETPVDAMLREVKEESNMKVLNWAFIGYQDIFEPNRTSSYARFVCKVEPYGEFVEDPDDRDITEMKLIDPKDYKQYFDWKEIGEHTMQRALELLSKL